MILLRPYRFIVIKEADQLSPLFEFSLKFLRNWAHEVLASGP